MARQIQTTFDGRGGVNWHGAAFSPCRTWRYLLWRQWRLRSEACRTVAFVLLNPSTADEATDDPTIRRCRGFAEAWDFDRLLILNLFAYRATDPAELWQTPADLVGPENDQYIEANIGAAELIVAGWGGNRLAPARAAALFELVRACGQRLHCLGTTTGGQPRHPLYLPKTAKPKLWTPPKPRRKAVAR